MYIVMTEKGERLNIRMEEEMKLDLKTAAKLRGLSLSGLVHFLSAKTIREEIDRNPTKFEEQKAKILKKSQNNLKQVKPKKPQAEKLNFSGESKKGSKSKEDKLEEFIYNAIAEDDAANDE